MTFCIRSPTLPKYPCNVECCKTWVLPCELHLQSTCRKLVEGPHPTWQTWNWSYLGCFQSASLLSEQTIKKESQPDRSHVLTWYTHPISFSFPDPRRELYRIMLFLSSVIHSPSNWLLPGEPAGKKLSVKYIAHIPLSFQQTAAQNLPQSFSATLHGDTLLLSGWFIFFFHHIDTNHA